MALGAKNKLGFIEGTATKPSPTSAGYNKWVRNDYVIRFCFSASVAPNIA